MLARFLDPNCPVHSVSPVLGAGSLCRRRLARAAADAVELDAGSGGAGELYTVAHDPCRRHCQVGSLAGAAHLLNDNTGVLRLAQ